jgi:hypothetical protein
MIQCGAQLAAGSSVAMSSKRACHSAPRLLSATATAGQAAWLARWTCLFPVSWLPRASSYAWWNRTCAKGPGQEPCSLLKSTSWIQFTGSASLSGQSEPTRVVHWHAPSCVVHTLKFKISRVLTHQHKSHRSTVACSWRKPNSFSLTAILTFIPAKCTWNVKEARQNDHDRLRCKHKSPVDALIPSTGESC